MKHTSLRLELGFWHVFISHSLIPRKHRTSVNFNAAMVLYCILQNQLVDIGFLIKREILELGGVRVDKQPLIFPSLITTFCREVGVDFGSDSFDNGLGPVGRFTWNDQLRERNPLGVIVQTGKKKSMHETGTSRQEAEMPKPTEIDQRLCYKVYRTLKLKFLRTGKQIADSRAESSGLYADIWGNLSDMKEALNLPVYPRKKKRPATSSPPSRGPVSDPKLQATMEISRKEHE
ncbi:hypothetical protein LWI28_019146 [Acer negundo]|uniref:Putative plant transposon protein domain-containing protein n=1 Tax=Acer negundo TaxID=4023 RepID=A0AAD5IJ75_ACENE|nr:hypothetical protein LWI28_019146 [Acer negundo]